MTSQPRPAKELELPRQRKGGEGLPWGVQWLRLHATTAGGVGSIPGRGTKIPHAGQCGQKIKGFVFFFFFKKEGETVETREDTGAEAL